MKNKVGLVKSGSIFKVSEINALSLQILHHFCFCNGQTGRAVLTHSSVDRSTLGCSPE